MLTGVLDAGRRRHFVTGKVKGRGAPREQRFVVERYGLQYFLYYWPNGFVRELNADHVLTAEGETYEFKKGDVRVILPLRDLQQAVRETSPLTRGES